MKRYKNYVYYLDRHHRNITILSLNQKTVMVVYLPSRIYLNKKLPLSILMRWEKNYILTYPSKKLAVSILHANEERADIKYKKLIKGIKNWWRGDLEKIIRQVDGEVTIWGI